MSKLRKVHKLVLTVSFDKPISHEAAARAVRDNIHGEFYCSWRPRHDPDGRYPEEFKVRGVQSGREL